MLKSLLLALDGISDHRAAVVSAIMLAERHGCAVKVLLTVDAARVAEPEAVGVGGVAHHAHLEEALLGKLRGALAAIRPEVEQAFAAAGIVCELDVREGDAEQEVALEAQQHDLLVLSSALRRRRDEDAVELDYALRLDHLIETVPGPILLADSEPLRPTGAVAVAYDASPGAARALHALLELGLAQDRPLHVVSVAASEEEASRTAGIAVALAARYGVAAEAHGLVAGVAEVGEALLQAFATLEPALVVMGAYGRRSWRDWLFGATTTLLLDRVKAPVLVSH
ncbi:universal stress protein [Benzoatithermus flavus]|uniref:Universal stress protein n=1 Tax=Benzoatithermus flavus TaxID=3108223 RepID=A0ABU8XXK2_9PROT